MSRTRLSASTSACRPVGGHAEDLIIANSAVMASVLTTALYVRELATRPVDRFTVAVNPN